MAGTTVDWHSLLTLARSSNPAERCHAVVQAQSALERLMAAHEYRREGDTPFHAMATLAANEHGIELPDDLRDVIRLRNMISHEGHVPGTLEAEDAVEVFQRAYEKLAGAFSRPARGAGGVTRLVGVPQRREAEARVGRRRVVSPAVEARSAGVSSAMEARPAGGSPGWTAPEEAVPEAWEDELEPKDELEAARLPSAADALEVPLEDEDNLERFFQEPEPAPRPARSSTIKPPAPTRGGDATDASSRPYAGTRGRARSEAASAAAAVATGAVSATGSRSRGGSSVKVPPAGEDLAGPPASGVDRGVLYFGYGALFWLIGMTSFLAWRIYLWAAPVATGDRVLWGTAGVFGGLLGAVMVGILLWPVLVLAGLILAGCLTGGLVGALCGGLVGMLAGDDRLAMMGALIGGGTLGALTSGMLIARHYVSVVMLRFR